MALAVVQGVANAHNAASDDSPTITFGSAPTHGNLMLVTGMTWGGAGHIFTPQNGWTNVVPPGTTGFQNPFYVYKYAGVSEPALQAFDSANHGMWSVTAWEISGVQGVIGGDLITQNLLINTQVGPTASPFTPGAISSAAGATLILYSIPSYATSPGGVNVTWSAGWTRDGMFGATTGDQTTGLFDYATGAHQIVPSAGGTSLQPTLTPSISTYWANSILQLGETAISGGHGNLPLLGVG